MHTSLYFNRLFSECFEELLEQFMTNDELSSLFAFDMKGLEYLLRTMDIESQEEQQSSPNFPADEELLISEKLIAAKTSG
jgi:hypothetical protein